jgi:ubiquinone/menaquinone biosynthesis C-methylase UbiE
VKVSFIFSGETMPNSHLLAQTRYTLFNTTAPRYNRLIMPALGPIAAELLKIAGLQPNDRVLDLGTATGAVALPAGPMVDRVTGVDFASAMLPLAQQNARNMQAPNISFYQGDMHQLPHPADTFSLVLSSFSFNSVDPAQVFPEVLRVLQPKGRLVFQEWGETDAASKLVKQTIKRYRVEEAEGALANFRLLGSTPKAWDALGEAEDVARFLREVGFSEVETFHTKAVVPLKPETFYNFRTAWTPYQTEFAAMTAENRTKVKDEILTQLNEWTEPDGFFIWQPELLQMIVRKQK